MEKHGRRIRKRRKDAEPGLVVGLPHDRERGSSCTWARGRPDAGFSMVREKSPVVVSLPHCSEGGSSCEWARGHHGAGLDLEKAPSDVFPQFGQDTDQRVPVGEEREEDGA